MTLTLAVCALDLASKHWAFGRLGFPGLDAQRLPIVGDYLALEIGLNEGALFGIGQGMRPVFILLSAVAIGGILCWLFVARAASDLLLTVSLAIMSGGILGNLWDRLGLHRLEWPSGPRQGQRVYAVRDWIHFQIDDLFDWPIFNMADTALVIGVALLMWQTFRTGGQGPVSSSIPTSEQP